MTDLTIFTAPKPFTNPHIAMIQRNAIRSWKQLGARVEVALIGKEEGIAEAAAELGATHLPDVRCNSLGTPLISSMFDLARQLNSSPLLSCINTDILLLPGFVETSQKIAAQAEQFLMVGQRWDLDVLEALDFSVGWEERLRSRLHSNGRLHPRGGSDYFVYPRSCFVHIPEFAIGRAGWDNWMIYEARQRGWPTVDATGAIDIIHQSHDYSHLPNGQPHYRLPETFENTRLAGGKRHIFHLIDCNWSVQGEKLRPYPVSWEKFWREVEIFPLVRLHSEVLGKVFYTLFHPERAYRDFRT
ncbi:MAG: hypothetical protein ABSE06_16465 [Anaerolineaceae bacterium]